MPPTHDTFYIAGGTLPFDASSYVVRQADTQLFNALLKGEFCYVLNTRQIGKSSLMIRTAQRLRDQGVLVALLDLTAIGQNVTPEQWYDGLLTLMAEQLRMRDALEDFWFANTHLGPMQRWMEALRQVVLAERTEPICLFVDEIDAVRSLPFATDEFFAGIRACYNRRVQDAAFQRLTFCLLGVTTPVELISNPRVSPFNIGTRIVLTDFTPEEAAPLAEGLVSRKVAKTQRERKGEAETTSSRSMLGRVLYWTGGHPYLTQRLCQAVSRDAIENRDMDAACETLFLSKQAQETDDNLAFVRNRLLHGEDDPTALLDLYRLILQGKRIEEDATNPLHNQLRLSGIVNVSDGVLRVRNRIYTRVFDARWALANLPEAEVRRQKAAYRRGVARAASIFGGLAALIGTLLVIAILNARYARSAETRANIQADNTLRLLYISDLNLIQREWEAGNIAHVQELLEETRDSKYRGFEWDYWNRRIHRSLRTFDLNQVPIKVTFSPDGRFLAALGQEGLLTVWYVESGRERFSVQMPPVIASVEPALAYSPDQAHLLVGSGKDLLVCDSATGQRLQTIPVGTQPIKDVVYSADGATLLTCSEDGTLRCFAPDSGRLLWALPSRPKAGNQDVLLKVWYSVVASDTETATWDAGGTIRLYSLRHPQEFHTLKTQFPGGVFALSHKGDFLVGRSKDGNLQILNTKTERVAYTLNTGRTSDTLNTDIRLVSLRFSPDDRLLFVCSPSGASVLDASTGRERDTYKDHPLYITDGEISHNGVYFVTSSRDKTITLYDLRQPSEPWTLRASADPLWLVSYSPDGKLLAVGSEEGYVYLWDVVTGQLVRGIKAHTEHTSQGAFSHDGSRLVTGGKEGLAKIWDARTGEWKATFRGHKNAVNSALFTPDDTEVVTGSDDKTAQVWNARTGELRLTLRGHEKSVESVALSPDGSRLVTGSDDLTTRLWDMRTGQLLRTFPSPAEVWSVAFSPDGSRIAIANLRNTAQIWDIATGHLLYTLTGHTHWVVAIAFSPDGKRLVTGSRDGTAKVWETQTGRELLTLRGHRYQVSGVAFSPNGAQIATASEDGNTRLWRCNP